MKYSLFKIQTTSHHCSAANPPMASIRTRNRISNMASDTHHLNPTPFSHLIYLIPSIAVLHQCKLSIPSSKQINLTAASGPLHLLFQIFRGLTLIIWVSIPVPPLPRCLLPSLHHSIPLPCFIFITTSLFENSIFIISSPLPLQFKFHKVSHLVYFKTISLQHLANKSICGINATNKHELGR